MSGYSEEEMRPFSFPALESRDRDRVLAAFERAMNREPQWFEASLQSRHGTRRDVDVTMIPTVVDGDPVGVFVVAADVTEDKWIRRRLAQALADAEAADDAKTLLVANVSHELRTPLAAVLGASELLSESTLDPAQQRLLDMIDRNGRSLLRLVEDLLDVTRMETGQLPLEDMALDVPLLVDQAVARVCPQAKDKGLAVTVDVRHPMPPGLHGDPLRLGQVLTKLLGNAVKFTDAGEIGIAVDWQRRADMRVDIFFRVRDTGIGIAPDDRERLLEPFMQADPSSTRRYGGTGLGLTISRQLVAIMDGDLSVESKPGVGSTFTVRVPLRRA